MTIRLATWGSNISGGFLRADVPQETSWDVAHNIQLAQRADQLGFAAMLFPIRYIGRIGGNTEGEGQLDPLTTVAAVAQATRQIHLITAVLPGFIHPAALAKIGTTLDHISGGRWHVNMVSGWFQEEQERYGLSWLDHGERYRRTEEYIQVLKGLWQEEEFNFSGRYYQIQGGRLRPFPLQKPYPAIFQGGNSQEAQEMAGKYSDWYFMNGAPIEELRQQIERVSAVAERHHRRVRFAVNAFVIARETEKEAQEEYQWIVDHANEEAIAQFRQRAKQAHGMWSRATTISDYVANNEGFRTGLIGSYEQVSERIGELSRAGIDLVLLTFRYPLQELPLFAQEVRPLLEKRLNQGGKSITIKAIK